MQEKYLRSLPGRIVGQTTDADGKRAFVMTLRTREQDIRREKATSNICTNEALYALAGSVYLARWASGSAAGRELCLQKAHYAAQEIETTRLRAGVSQCAVLQRICRNPAPARVEINEALLAQGIIGGFDLSEHYPAWAMPCFCA